MQINMSSDLVPPRDFANSILNSENKLELIVGLVQDKRCFESSLDSAEEQLKQKDELLMALNEAIRSYKIMLDANEKVHKIVIQNFEKRIKEQDEMIEALQGLNKTAMSK